MNEGVAQAFDRAAALYDSERRMLVPCFDAFYGAAIAALHLPSDRELDILDLGSGTGLLACMIAVLRPATRFTLIDVSAEMLEEARARFARLGAPEPRILIGDYVTAPLGGFYDAIVSALSIHHLADPDKQGLYRRVHAALVPGGRFVNAEQVLGPNPDSEARYDSWWESEARRLGADSDMIARARERMRHDRSATLEAQLGWLRATGFEEVACWFQENRFAVFGGRRRHA